MKALSRNSILAVIGVTLAASSLRCSSSGNAGSGAGPSAAAEAGAPDVNVEPGASGEGGVSDLVTSDGSLDAKVLIEAEGLDAAPEGDAPDTSAPDAARPPYSPCPPPGTPCIIMPVGDSITAGYDSTTGGGYRLQLLHDIWAAKHDATFVGDNSSGPNTLDGRPFPKKNEGYSGYTIDNDPAGGRNGISPLVPPALVKYAPHIVTLMIGTNDMGTNNDVANAPVRLSNLIDAIIKTSPNALLVLAQITPTGDKGVNARIQAYNAAMPKIVATRVAAGKHILLVDMYSAFTADANYLNDYMNGSLHPNDRGYALMGDTWYAALASHF